MVPWATKRKIQYTLGFLGVFFLIIAYPLFSALYGVLNKPPTCFDGIRNQDETGIDCGGACILACQDSVKKLVISWSRIFKVDEGVYDVAALIRNPNSHAAIKDVKYEFEVFDSANNLITERTGVEYINAGEEFAIFEANIRTGKEVPARVDFVLSQNNDWTQSKVEVVPIRVITKTLTNKDRAPRLDVTLENTDYVEDYEDIDIVALIKDTDGNVIASSATYLDYFPADSSREVFFTWPQPFQTIKARECANLLTSTTSRVVIPGDIGLVFDRSGSMNDDGGVPPQPISNAKSAAQVFVKAMSENDQIALISFATEASNPIDQELTNNLAAVSDKINAITIGQPDNEQHTNLGDAIEKAMLELTSTRHNEDARSAMIVLTDGIATRPRNPDDPTNYDYASDYARVRAQTAQNNNILIYVIGLGGNVNEEFLSEQIATTPEYYFNAASSEELASIYGQIAEEVNKESVLTTTVCQDDIFIPDIHIRVKNQEIAY